MWLINDCKKIDTFKWSPKGYTIKSGKVAAFDDWISCYPTHKDGYNKYFDQIYKYKNIKVLLNQKIVIGGNFYLLNGNANIPPYFFKLNSDGTIDTTFNPGANSGGGSSSSIVDIKIQVKERGKQ